MQAFFSVFPAQAGMIQSINLYLQRCCGIPRASGDDPIAGYILDASKLYSPRKRG